MQTKVIFCYIFFKKNLLLSVICCNFAASIKNYGIMKIFATTDRELEILICALEEVGYTAESPAAVLHDRLYDIYLGRTNSNEKIDYYDGI